MSLFLGRSLRRAELGEEIPALGDPPEDERRLLEEGEDKKVPGYPGSERWAWTPLPLFPPFLAVWPGAQAQSTSTLALLTTQ